MNFKSVITLKSELLSTTLVFFSGIFIILISLIATWGMEHVTRNESFWLYLGYSIPFFVSFCGSLCLLFYFFKKSRGLLVYVIPFSIITVFGFFIAASQVIYFNTIVRWPWNFTTDSLFYYVSLLLTPAMTFLLLPFITETTKTTKEAFRLLLILSGISLIFLIIQFIDSVFPLMDPEFIMSGLWDFNSSNMIVGILSGLFLFIGLPLSGVFSILLMLEYTRDNPSTEEMA